MKREQKVRIKARLSPTSLSCTWQVNIILYQAINPKYLQVVQHLTGVYYKIKLSCHRLTGLEQNRYQAWAQVHTEWSVFIATSAMHELATQIKHW